MFALDLYGKKHEVTIDEVSWRISIYGIVINNGKILLSPQHGEGYDLPGGGMDIDETFEQAVEREVKEETGLDVRAMRQLTAKESLFVWKPDVPSQRKVQHSILIYYECNFLGGEISTDGFDEHEKEYARAAEWVDLSKLDTIAVASSVDYRDVVKALL